jgi:TetR/AcrR family transcriptional regulator, cholesterol catabolism regulator
MTRDEILMAAAQVFNQKGYHAASMQDIANTVNLQKASLYHHVSSKQEILLELLDRALELLIERLLIAVEQPSQPDIKLRCAIRTYLETLVEFHDLSAVLILEHRSLPPELNQVHIPRRDRFEGIWRNLILAGKEAGLFDCPDPALASRALLGVLNWTITWYRHDGPLTATEIADQFADLFLEGLLTRSDIGRG